MAWRFAVQMQPVSQQASEQSYGPAANSAATAFLPIAPLFLSSPPSSFAKG